MLPLCQDSADYSPPALAVSQGYLQLEAGFPQVQQLVVHLPKLP